MAESDSTTVYNSRHLSSMLSNSSQIMNDYPFQRPPLGFGLNALSPYITEEVMGPHFEGHQKIVEALNEAFKTDVGLNYDADASNSTPEKKLEVVGSKIYLQENIKFFGGGHIIHSLFWENLAPESDNKGIESDGAQEIKKAIENRFCSIDGFESAFKTAAVGIHGNGWGWLGLKKLDPHHHPDEPFRRLEIVTTHDSDLPPESYIPIIGIDVAEHAFLLNKDPEDPAKSRNTRATYLDGIWNVINFEVAQKRYNDVVKVK